MGLDCFELEERNYSVSMGCSRDQGCRMEFHDSELLELFDLLHLDYQLEIFCSE